MPSSLYKFLRISLLLLSASLIVNGCAGNRPQNLPPPQETVKPRPSKPPKPLPPKEQQAIPQEEPPLQRETILKEAPLPPPVQKEVVAPELKPQKGPAHILYQNAALALQKGDSAQAEMLLERALRIEPRNGWYWNAMGRVKYAQGASAQAIQFWKKSNSLAGKDAELTGNNNLLLNKASGKTYETGTQ